MKTIKTQNGYIEIIDFSNYVAIGTYRKGKTPIQDKCIERIKISKTNGQTFDHEVMM